MEVAFPSDPTVDRGDGGDTEAGPTLTAIEAQRVTAVLQDMVKKLTLLGTLTSAPASSSSSSSSSRSPSFHVSLGSVCGLGESCLRAPFHSLTTDLCARTLHP